MFYVYVLKSLNSNWLYIGYTANLKQRIQTHNNGKCVTTSRFKPMKLVYYEAYYSSNDAEEREKQLKQHGASLGHLKKRIKESLKSAG